MPQPAAPGVAPQRYASAEVVADIARERRLSQLSEIDAIDGKAANLIGFAAVVLGLLFTSSLAERTWDASLSTGAGLLAGSLVPLGFALWPRTYKFNPNVAGFRRLATHLPPHYAHVIAAASIERAIQHNQTLLNRKARAVRIGTAVLVASVLVTGGRLIYALQTGETAGKDAGGHGAVHHRSR